MKLTRRHSFLLGGMTAVGAVMAFDMLVHMRPMLVSGMERPLVEQAARLASYCTAVDGVDQAQGCVEQAAAWSERTKAACLPRDGKLRDSEWEEEVWRPCIEQEASHLKLSIEVDLVRGSGSFLAVDWAQVVERSRAKRAAFDRCVAEMGKTDSTGIILDGPCAGRAEEEVARTFGPLRKS